MPSWFVHIATQYPQWDVLCKDHDLSDAKDTYICAWATVLLVHVDSSNNVHVFAAWHDQKEAFELPGGRVEYGTDRKVVDCAAREWEEEVNPTDQPDFRLQQVAEV